VPDFEPGFGHEQRRVDARRDLLELLDPFAPLGVFVYQSNVSRRMKALVQRVRQAAVDALVNDGPVTLLLEA
jgi:hypothetical protein